MSIVLFGCGASGALWTAETGDGGTSVGKDEVSLPDSPPGIVGVVTDIGREPGTEGASVGTILVEESPGQGKSGGCSKGLAEKGCNRLLLDITGQTSILQDLGGRKGLARATEADLRRGQRVSAWHENVVTKSYPGRTGAQVVVIEETV